MRIKKMWVRFKSLRGKYRLRGWGIAEHSQENGKKAARTKAVKRTTFITEGR